MKQIMWLIFKEKKNKDKLGWEDEALSPAMGKWFEFAE